MHELGAHEMLIFSEGKACAAHFDVINPLDKQVIISEGDPAVPPRFAARPVCPNIAAPKMNTQSKAPKHVMHGVEALWL